jgi:hypothetical protein
MNYLTVKNVVTQKENKFNLEQEGLSVKEVHIDTGLDSERKSLKNRETPRVEFEPQTEVLFKTKDVDRTQRDKKEQTLGVDN